MSRAEGTCRPATHASATTPGSYAASQQTPYVVRQRTEGRASIMKWSRELRSAGRGLRTALRAASAMVSPSARQVVPHHRAASHAGELILVPDFGADAGGLT